MADYSKLKVNELKEELKNRGIPITGLKLKQNFIDRLIEADASVQTDASDATDNPTGVAEDSRVIQQATANHAQHVESRDEQAQSGDVISTQPITQDSTAKNENDPSFPDSGKGEMDLAQDELLAQPQRSTGPALEGSTEQPLSEDRTNKEPVHEDPVSTAPEVDEGPGSATVPIIDGLGTPIGPPQTLETPPPSTIRAPSTAASTPSSIQVPAKELIEDTKKRKRRSVTPPPSAADIAQKRAKASDGSPRMTKPVDTTIEDESGIAPDVSGELALKETKSEPSALDQMQAATDAAEVMREGDGLPHGEQSETIGATSTKPLEEEKNGETMSERQPESSLSPEKQSTRTGPGVSRFGGLKRLDANQPQEQTPNSSSGPGGIADQTTLDDQKSEERAVAPALHPATSSLYLRNFKRPLHLPTLRAYVVKIAHGPTLAVDAKEDPIVAYFLDSIRTHALISFRSITAASRVRSALHETRFPDEKTRDPLWVDFIPDDKVQSWIDIETESGGRGTTQRWEVVYEDGPRGIEAVLQEVGGGAGPRRPSAVSQRQASMSGVQKQPSTSDVRRPSPVAGIHPDRLPLVPRVPTDTMDSSRETHRRVSQPETSGTGFRALDELFSFTTAKPKLYYKPVPQRVADRRVDAIKDLRVGHADMGKSGDEDMKRYSFDMYRGEEEWVDKGPEFGFGRRGVERLRGGAPMRGRYRGGGGGGGGRGGYRERDRDDGWRGGRRW